MLGGYMGKILRVDLSGGKTDIVTVSEDVCRQYLGGSGLGAKYLFEMTTAGTDPLGPDNPLFFLTGPLTGTRVPLSGRHAVVAKSPLTGIWGESDSGGTWGVKLKRAGYDGIIVTGKAQSPVYLWVHEAGAEIRPAAHLWGKDTFETETAVLAETHRNAGVACIGPAGEKMVLLAAIMNDGKDARAAGRCGLGAVMGSKNLKAVAVHGTLRPPVADPELLDSLVKQIVPQIVEKTRAMSQYGTSGGLMLAEKMGDLPIQNWRAGKWEQGAEKISGQTMAETILTGSYHCHGCVIGCGRVAKQYFPPFAGTDGGGPEYETLGMLGSAVLVDDLEAVAKANELCNRLGIDTISTGSAIAFAMEAYEYGIITADDTGGMKLAWGDSAAMLRLVEMIGRQEGIGALLGQGTRRAAAELGGLAPEFAINVKGLDFPAHDPRAYSSLAVGYATSNRGACHLQGYSYAFERGLKSPDLGYPEPLDRFAAAEKGVLAAETQNLMCLFDSLKVCKFILSGGVDVHHLAEWLNAVTGWDTTVEELLRTGERLYNLKRLYNVRCGISRKDDILPPRILTQPRREGGAGEHLPAFGPMLDEYYRHRGWSEEGIPTPAKLRELGLAEPGSPA
ncbi:MAG: aldehyde ferredoxin oxidoreductase family protein [bacterium]